ncbi:hypothetical protein LCGC14_2918730, partial [marine sediment metagenome]
SISFGEIVIITLLTLYTLERILKMFR